LAYVVYSSGTTGAPKGVLAPHRGSVHSYRCRDAFSPYGPGDRVACNVFFVWELLRPLLKGGTVYVVPDDMIYDPRPLLDFLDRHQITEMLFTPSLLESVINAVDEMTIRRKMASLNVVWLNGEVVTTNLKHRLLDTLPAHTRLLNTYSISECHDVANEDLRTASDLPSGLCAVGRAMPEVTLRLLDEDLQAVRDGEAGELFIGGPCLARGYLNKPELTARQFVTLDGERFYRTGDVGLMHPDGRLEIRGRCDDMVKIRGYSVQLGAIETALLAHAHVKSCAVVAEGETAANKRLVAYVVRDDDATWAIHPHTGTCEAIQTQLETYLPHYMIPRVYVELDLIPLSPTTGKLDRKRLPDITIERREATLDDLQPGQPPPRTLHEQVMRRLWEYVLQMEPGSLRDEVDFFDCGGHSLLAVELTQLIETYFQVQLNVREIYEYSTIEQLVAHVNGETRQKEFNNVSLHDDARLEATIVPSQTCAPLSVSQARSIFITGSTGFLGAFILEELLRSTADEVRMHCLVRAKSGALADGRQRIVTNLQQYQLWNARYEARIVPVVGDLGEVHLGLSEDGFDDLAERVDFIVHSGALVNYVYPYAILKASMVDGTREVLRLACTAVTKPVHYISTNGIFPGGDPAPYLENADIEDFADRLEGGYGPGKWVAETLVWQAVSRGLPVCLYRPGNIGHHSLTGAVNANDFQYQIMRACQTLGCAPDSDDWRFEMTPVDFLVGAIGRFAQEQAHYGQVYNVVQAEATPARLVFDLMRANGQISDYVPLTEWKGRLQAAAERGNTPFLSVLAQSLDDVEPYLLDTSRYDRSQFDRAVSLYDITCAETDADYFSKLFT
ncbi:MAG: thioester reductase domain-containing protein, partial [Candidatus Tectomicrobia bacterium]